MASVIERQELRGGDAATIRALKAGDERAFCVLVEAHGALLLRVAMTYVPSRAVAEEVVQETWLGVLKGLDRFEGRASLKTWIFSIAANIARTRAVRERRSLPFSALAGAEASDDEPAVDADRFLPADHPQWPGHWRPRRPLGRAPRSGSWRPRRATSSSPPSPSSRPPSGSW